MKKNILRGSQAGCVEQCAGTDRDRRYDRSECAGNEAISDCTGGSIIRCSQTRCFEQRVGTHGWRRRIIEAVERHSETKPKYPQEQNILRCSRAGSVEQCAKVKNKSGFYKKLIAFSLVELMISLITISCIVAAFAPVITKKLKKQDIAISIAQSSEIFAPCLHVENQTAEKRFKQGGNNSSPCQMCTQQNCIICNQTCESGYLDSKACKCESCDKFKGEGPDGTCEKCTQDGCTLCKKETDSWSKGYIIKNGKCEKCNEANLPSNGVDTCAVPCVESTGYYCENNVLHSCKERYDMKCTSCNRQQDKCLGCTGMYYLKADGTCGYCNTDSGDLHCGFCNTIDNCTACFEGSYLVQYTQNKYKCAKCNSNCLKCSGTATNCTDCATGKYLTSSKTCVDCTLDKCDKCKNNVANQQCEVCLGGYYLDNTGQCKECKSKFGTSCVICDKNECLACKPGSYVKNATANPSCATNNSSFNCSDSIFIKIGNLCITRKNMGDDRSLPIPSTVNILSPYGAYCPIDQKCCWQATDRKTVCNGSGAEEICKKFNYGGLKWRLPKPEEMTNWYAYSVGLAEEGLGLCSRVYNPNLANCPNMGGCNGIYDSCYPAMVWGQKNPNADSYWLSYIYLNSIGGWYTGQNDYGPSVRCVANMATE